MSQRRFAENQPTAFVFSRENLDWAQKTIARYPKGRQASAIIPLLWRAHEQCGGWLPRAACEYVAKMLDMPKIRAYEVATFYTMFNLAPTGKHHVQVCTTTPCWLRGSEEIVKTCQRVMGVKEGEISADGMFSYVEVECLGACVNAPMIQIEKDFYEDLDGLIMERMLGDLKAGKKLTPGPQIDRKNSAPVGGPQTLTDPSLYGTK